MGLGQLTSRKKEWQTGGGGSDKRADTIREWSLESGKIEEDLGIILRGIYNFCIMMNMTKLKVALLF